jgi:hypothetical protein
MKCLGMLLIVWGHVAHETVEWLTPPVLSKQFGVAFFMFVLAFSLAREKRASKQVCFNRLFEIYLFGIACAMLMSGIASVRLGRPNGTNYLPFLLGVNVVFDYFPANSTTWFIGTYLHVLLAWALVLRHRRIGPWLLSLSAGLEILICMVLMEGRGLYTAYMVLPNWATVFLLGMYYGQQHEESAPVRRAGLVYYLAGLGTLLIVWPALINPLIEKRSFPFMRFGVGPDFVNLGLTSVTATFLYVAYTWLAYQITRRFSERAVVQFFARNTLIVFIAHMPVYHAVNYMLARRIHSHGALVAVRLLACWLGLAVLSEGICRLIQPKRLRDKLWRLLTSASAAADHEQTTSDCWQLRETGMAGASE